MPKGSPKQSDSVHGSSDSRSLGDIRLIPRLTFLTRVAGESPRASALPVDAASVAVAVGAGALVVAQLALGALPAGEAAAGALLVVAVAAAQHGADAWKEEKARYYYFLANTIS